MSEIKRDAAADLAMCEAAPKLMEPYVTSNGGVVVLNGPFSIDKANACCTFIYESRTALPHWINRAVAAEAEVERLREALRSISTYEPPPGCEDIGNEVMNRIAKRALEKT
jgi:hypothetical protein